MSDKNSTGIVKPDQNIVHTAVNACRVFLVPHQLPHVAQGRSAAFGQATRAYRTHTIQISTLHADKYHRTQCARPVLGDCPRTGAQTGVPLLETVAFIFSTHACCVPLLEMCFYWRLCL